MDLTPLKKAIAALPGAARILPAPTPGGPVMAPDSANFSSPARQAAAKLGPDNFLLGANLPWIDCGLDFGANAWQPKGGLSQPERAAKLEAVFAKAEAQGIQHLRWWMLADGRAGVRFGKDGTPLGLDEHFFADVDTAIAAAKRHGIKLTFAVLDFYWCKKAKLEGGVQMGGHGDTLADPAKRKALIDNVLTPIFKRYANEPAIEAWDLINEPDWVTRGAEAWFFQPSVPFKAMRAYLAEAAAAAHRFSSQPVTVGLASAKGLPLATGLGLDLYHVHWYDSTEGKAKLARPAAEYKLDAPLVLGEFPSKGSKHSPQQILDIARQAGYGGAMIWSLGATDDATNKDAAAGALEAWGKAHADKLAR